LLSDAHRRIRDEGSARRTPRRTYRRRAAEESESRESDRPINGVVTYVGKDIANQFWKFGLLGRDFNYRLFGEQENGRLLWSTTSGPGDRTRRRLDAPAHLQRDRFSPDAAGAAEPGASDLRPRQEAERSIHFSYEMVALARDRPRAQCPPPSAEDGAKPFVEVSGRKGLGVKIDDLRR
jgi:arginyl-tRNA synthetase